MKVNRKNELFFREQDKKINNLIENLIEFRIDVQANQQKEIKQFFNSIKVSACKFGFEELFKLGEYYENYIETSKDINENSHKVFSEILKGTGIIKRHIKQLRIENDNKFDCNNLDNNIDMNLKKGNILVLDDDRLISTILKDAFEAEGHNVITTTDHEEAIEYILYKNINIALIDIVMPKMSGFEVFDILKKSGVDIPIIFLSGKSFINYKVEALSRGVDDYITKPFEIKEVIARVERSLGRSKQYKVKLNRDELTGVYNKAFFYDYLNNILEKKEHLKQKYCVAFMDLDDFKYINDNYGHMVGDYALKDFSCFLKINLGENDTIFRFGGDEFIVLFENNDVEESYEKMEQLREKLGKTIFKYKRVNESIKLNVSIGITGIVEYDNVEDILNRSDKCLYESKKLGKNTIVCDSDVETLKGDII